MKTILSYGMGIESLLVYWCENRSRFDFDLTEDLIAVTTMTGDEHLDYVEFREISRGSVFRMLTSCLPIIIIHNKGLDICLVLGQTTQQSDSRRTAIVRLMCELLAEKQSQFRPLQLAQPLKRLIWLRDMSEARIASNRRSSRG